MDYKNLLIKLLPMMDENKTIFDLVEWFLDETAERHGLDGGAKILKDLGLSDADLETFGFNPKDVSDDVDLRQCEHCKKEIHEGHVILDGSFISLIPKFYLCTDCFSKFYNKDVAEIMYNDGFQYFTEWED